MSEQNIILQTLSGYPCDWDDLLAENGETYATVYTLKSARQENNKAEPGIRIGKDGIYDIVVDAPSLTKRHVAGALKKLARQTGIEYVLQLQ